jgi:hypothetical protein
MGYKDLIRRKATSLLSRLLAGVRSLTGFLTPRDDWIEWVRGFLLRSVHPLATRVGRPTIREKGPADYVCTVPIPAESLEQVLYPTYRRNFLATKKYREPSGDRQWAAGSWVHTHTFDGKDQHHVYVFPAPDGGTDVYAHREANVTDPDGHQHGPQIPGDPDEILRDTLEDAGVERYTRTL